MLTDQNQVNAEDAQMKTTVSGIGQGNQQLKLKDKSDKIEIASKIVRYWFCRARHLKIAISLVGGIIDEMAQHNCEICGQSWGLTVQLGTNVEDLYQKFLKERRLASLRDDENQFKDILLWQQYFRS